MLALKMRRSLGYRRAWGADTSGYPGTEIFPVAEPTRALSVPQDSKLLWLAAA